MCVNVYDYIMYVCLRHCMHVCAILHACCIYTLVSMCARCMCVCVCVHIPYMSKDSYVCMYLCVHICCMCVYWCVWAGVGVGVGVSGRARARVCMCMCMCTCMHGYIPVSGNSSNIILVTSIAAPN